MTYKEARVYLDEVSKYGSVLGLDTIRGLLRELGDPQNDLKFIHIAGTNGKGSVLAYISTILSKAGYRTGRYVSPTVVSYLERIQIDGEWISQEEFAESAGLVRKAIARMEAKGETSPTVFEAETAIAFLYFKKKKCHIVVLETGLGGTLDATNIVKNTQAAVFTSISRDHMGFLGGTLEEIARNKAGIIKHGCVTVTARQEPEVMEVLKEKAAQVKSQLITAFPDRAEVTDVSWSGQNISYGDYRNLRLNLAGTHQVENACLALEVLESLRGLGYTVSGEAVREGFAETRWPGRFECVSQNPLFFVDGAHNEGAAERLKETVEACLPGRKLILIMGVFRDKEYHKILQTMGPMAEKIFTVDLPDRQRSLPGEELKKAADMYCPRTEAAADIPGAVKSAWREAGAEGAVLAFGSLSYLGQVRNLVKRMGEKQW